MAAAQGFTAVDLVPVHFDDPAVRLPDRIPARALDGLLAKMSRGPDHLRGEALLAWIKDGEGKGALVTTHAVIVLTDERVMTIPYPAITGIEVDPGLGSTTLKVVLGPRAVRWNSSDSARLLAGFLHDLLSVDPGARVPQDDYLLPPQTDADPLGVGAAAARMPCMEPRLAALLQLLPAAYQAGGLDRTGAYRLVAGTMLLERTLFSCRGQAGDGWASCLPMADMEAVLVGVMGNITHRTVSGDGVVTLVWGGDGQGGDVVKEAAASLAGTAMAAGMAAVLGFGVGVSPKTTKSIKRIEATLRGVPMGCTLAVRATRTQELHPLGMVAPDRLLGLFQHLRRVEPEVMLQRATLGLGASLRPPDAALKDEVMGKASQLVPGIDTSTFFTPSGELIAASSPNPRYRRAAPARPAALPKRSAGHAKIGEVPEWDRLSASAGLVHLLTGFANLVYPFIAMLVVAMIGKAIDDNTSVDAGFIAVFAVLPMGLLPLAFLELAAGVAGMWKKSAARGLVLVVCALQVLSTCLGGFVSLVSAAIVLLIQRRVRQLKDQAG